MNDNSERRREERLDYRWPVWFGKDFTQTMSQGQMANISGGGIAFDYSSEGTCLRIGECLTVRFSIPRFQGDDPTTTVNVTRTGQVRRIEETESKSRRAALQFDTPLPLAANEASTLASLCRGDLESQPCS